MLNLIKTVIHKLYILVLMAFTVWYGFFLYPVIFGHSADHSVEALVVESTERAGSFLDEAHLAEESMFDAALKEQGSTATTDLGYMVIEEQYVQGHFHHVGMKVESDDSNLCLRCHGAVPHDKAKSIRAFLNMHAFYVACETCHIQPKEDAEAWAFRWYDKAEGNIISNPPGLTSLDKSMYGNYGAKIAPGFLKSDGNFRFLNGAKERAFVAKYLKEKDVLSSTQQSKMKKIIHRNINDKPLLCDGCHTADKEKAYLPFVQLGYPNRRMHDLTSTEVVGMIEKYQEFYMPKFLLPGDGWHEETAEGEE
ncbi:MAG: hypothetical protein L3J28_08170 [Candidatus Polarisedimenticolaceae bacterium]|nr:hypothetical protein [Candidatus Polarisedimenticolaceae bacterium]